MRRMYYELVGVVQGKEMTPYRQRLVMVLGILSQITIVSAVVAIELALR